MTIIIGVDPHKASHTAIAVSNIEEELGSKRIEEHCSSWTQIPAPA